MTWTAVARKVASTLGEQTCPPRQRRAQLRYITPLQKSQPRAMSVMSVSQSAEGVSSRWKIEALFIVVVAAAALWSCYWLLDPRNFFRADDWAWLGFSAFRDLGDFLNVFPKIIYNCLLYTSDAADE